MKNFYLVSVSFAIFSTIKANETFPCDLVSFSKPLPKLILLGETHGSKKAEDMERESLQRVKNRKALYGVEGDFNDEKNYSKKAKQRLNEEYVLGVYGIDDPIVHTLSTLMKCWNNPEKYKNELYGAFEASHNHRLLRSLWDKTKLQLTTKKEKHVGELINILVNTDGNPSPDFLQDMATMRSIIEKWVKVLAEHAHQPENKERFLPPPNLPTLVHDFFYGPVDNSILFKGVWRDILMTRNIAKLYCEAAAKGLELRISVGNNHIPGIKTLLNNLAKNMKLPIEDLSESAGQNFLSKENLKLYWNHFSN